MKYDLFISDFDYTLGIKPGIIDKETVEAIKEYQKKGGIFCIVTGRSYMSIKEICEDYDLKGVVGAFQGATIVDLDGDKKLFNGGLEPELASKIVRQLTKDKVTLAVWINECLYYEEPSFYVDMYIKHNGKPYAEKSNDFCKKVDSLEQTIKELNLTVEKVCALQEDHLTAPYVEKYSKLFGEEVLVNSGAKCLIEFINPKYHKGFAVEFLAKHYGVSLDKVIAVGDSSNDALLMNEKWHGVAVGDAEEELKKMAKEITVPFKDKPVLTLLKKYC